MKRAGVPPHLYLLRLEHFQAFTPKAKAEKAEIGKHLGELIQQTSKHQFIVLSGPPLLVKPVSYLLLKATLLAAEGVAVDLATLAEWFLRDDKSAFRWVKETPNLVFQFGNEYSPQNMPIQVHRYLAAHVLTSRAEPRFRTIVATNRTKPTIGQYDEQLEFLTRQPWVQLADLTLAGT